MLIDTFPVRMHQAFWEGYVKQISMLFTFGENKTIFEKFLIQFGLDFC